MRIIKDLASLSTVAFITILIGSSFPSTLSVITTNNHHVFGEHEQKAQFESTIDKCGNGDFSIDVICQDIASEIEGDNSYNTSV